MPLGEKPERIYTWSYNGFYEYLVWKQVNSVAFIPQANSYRSRGPGFDSRRYQIFWEVVGLERGPLSFVSIIEELLEWKSSGSGLENRY
jgi:hypothetical protein